MIVPAGRRSAGLWLFAVFGGEIGEICGGFVEHDPADGEDAALHGVVVGCGFPLGGARSGRFYAVGEEPSLSAWTAEHC
jgi:hypothetical protein